STYAWSSSRITSVRVRPSLRALASTASHRSLCRGALRGATPSARCPGMSVLHVAGVVRQESGQHGGLVGRGGGVDGGEVGARGDQAAPVRPVVALADDLDALVVLDDVRVAGAAEELAGVALGDGDVHDLGSLSHRCSFTLSRCSYTRQPLPSEIFNGARQ